MCHDQVVSEIRDGATRERLANLPYKLILKSPTEQSVTFGEYIILLQYLCYNTTHLYQHQ